METQTQEGIAKTEAWVQDMLRRSATDMPFRQKLIDNPRGAISEFLGRDVPASLDVVFVENKADATWVLPDLVDAKAEISESELEAVSGGSEAIAVGLAIVAATIYLYNKLENEYCNGDCTC
jgi:hypothetical protein